MKLKLIFLTLFLATAQFAMAQVRFEAKVSKKKLGVNERLRVDFEMNKDGDNFTPPSFSGFTVVGGPNQSISNSWINGKRSYAKTFSYFLEPTRRGQFSIKQATIEIDGQTYKTLPIRIEVTGAVEKPKDGNNTDFVASENLHLIAEVSKANPYLNEAITVVYKLYVSPRISVSNWRELDSPKYSDFWSQAIDMKQLKIENGEYKGEPYRYVVLRKTVLYPQKTGKLNIAPLTLTVSVDVPTKRRDIFGGRLYTTVNKTVAAGNRVIEAKPLPLQGKPDDFSGAVGDFDFKVTTNKTELDATESLDAKVLVTGNGNLKLFDLPKLNVPNGLEQYEPQHNERVRTNLTGMGGNISDTYTLVPQYKGKYPIPSISFSYFDLKTETYKRITSDEIVINVKTGPDDGDTVVTSESGGTNKKLVTQVGNQFRFLKLKADLQPIKKEYFFKSTVYWLSLTAPLLAIPLFLFFGKKRQERLSDVSGNRVRKADKLARKYLSEAKKNLGNQKEFYIAMERALHNYLKAKLHIQTSDMSKERIQRLLKERDVEDAISIEFIALLESCEFARYTPSSTSAMQQDYDKASRVIASIDKQL
ncbi:oxygen tolerance protein BatD [Aquimarina sp. MAR_2010_214]|uniref:BatD family protein n=1 Tax=Aquimarina sp. MAR_2010_214 TaxID=1250026 RepID=UPI000C70E091|nr:BatD family protein [Aquimarina sp. MAR_2010_214]PKV48919.1 oxygen tolerance protein BatD [Aquimarina sp. MAR_2010_214]